MKNYHFVFAVVLSSLTLSGVQAGNIKDPASTPAATVAAKHAAATSQSPGAAYQFVDADLAPTARKIVNAATGATGLPIERLTGAMDKAPAQSFAGGTVAAAHAGPSKTGLGNTQEVASRIAEPASELLLLVALSALAIAIRRQSPN